MNKVGLVVKLEAKPGREMALAELLMSGKALVDNEPETVSWFAFRTGPSSFGIFDVFPSPLARQQHLSGKLATALMASAPDLLAKAPVIEELQVLSEKV
jgi:quinol monooxygenase YgiN